MGNIFTDARVSTLDQNTDMQVEELKAAYPDAVRSPEPRQRIGSC
jgi:DNA invertase Pin-like site-specific DNA recombinase